MMDIAHCLSFFAGLVCGVVLAKAILKDWRSDECENL